MSTRKLFESTLLNAVASTDNGTWIDVTSWSRVCVHVIPTGTSTSKICGSCEPTIPANSDHGVQIGSDITSETLYEITAKLKWLKVYVSARTNGTITAYAVGETPVYGL